MMTNNSIRPSLIDKWSNGKRQLKANGLSGLVQFSSVKLALAFTLIGLNLLFASSSWANQSNSTTRLQLFEKAMFLAADNRLIKAAQLLENLIKDQPEFGRARLELALIYTKLAYFDAAREQLNWVVSEPSTPPQVKKNIYTLLDKVSYIEEEFTTPHQFSGFIDLAFGYDSNTDIGLTESLLSPHLFEFSNRSELDGALSEYMVSSVEEWRFDETLYTLPEVDLTNRSFLDEGGYFHTSESIEPVSSQTRHVKAMFQHDFFNRKMKSPKHWRNQLAFSSTKASENDFYDLERVYFSSVFAHRFSESLLAIYNVSVQRAKYLKSNTANWYEVGAQIVTESDRRRLSYGLSWLKRDNQRRLFYFEKDPLITKTSDDYSEFRTDELMRAKFSWSEYALNSRLHMQFSLIYDHFYSSNNFNSLLQPSLIASYSLSDNWQLALGVKVGQYDRSQNKNFRFYSTNALLSFSVSEGLVIYLEGKWDYLDEDLSAIERSRNHTALGIRYSF